MFSPTPVTPSAPGVEAMLDLKSEYLVPCAYHFYGDPPRITAAAGCHLIDEGGRRYLDCLSGVSVMNAGHCTPAIIEPAIEQIRTLQHTTTIYLTEPMLRLAERLAAITPGPLRRSFFCASGSEAVEGALLTAALHTGRRMVVSMEGSLHGRTRWAMNATGLPMWRTDPHPMDDVLHVPYGDADRLEKIFDLHGHEIAAVIAEPVQGNGGINIAVRDFWLAARALCREHGALLVLDEIQTGMNRTGHWFASEHWGFVPDIMAMSKALGNGFPIAAFITTDEIAASYTRPGASTFGGNPVSAIAALATLDFHEEHDLGAAAEVRGRELRQGLDSLSNDAPFLGRPRGLGLMQGVPVLDEHGAPDADRCDQYLESLKDHGVLAGKTGADRNVLTFLPPLIIDHTLMGELLHALDTTIHP